MKEIKPTRYFAKTSHGENTRQALEQIQTYRYHKPTRDWSFKPKHAEPSAWRVLDPSEY